MTWVAVWSEWDSQFWHQVKKGFFALKECIPVLLRESDIV